MKNHPKVGCELCEAPANMYCESDRASLCWRCDNKVHGANFLVAKHSRCVLCHNCQAVTPWTASGPKLPPSMSLCLACVNPHTHLSSPTHTAAQASLQSRVNDEIDNENENDNDDESSLYEDEDEEYCTEDEDEEDEDNENQVVPLTFDNGGETPLSMVLSGCSSDEAEAEEEDDNSHLLTVLPSSSLKRKRDLFIPN